VSSFSSPMFRKVLPVAAPAALVLALLSVSVAFAGLVSGSLPSAGFTYTSVTDNTVNITGDGIHFKTKDSINIKTTYSRVAPSSTLLGWHYHNGPNFVTVTNGTLTLYDDACNAIDLPAGHSYVEATGQVINARVDPVKNSTLPSDQKVEWFTTRLYPMDAPDPGTVAVPPSCTP